VSSASTSDAVLSALRDWIVADHAAAHHRFRSAIAMHVPPPRWNEQPAGGGPCVVWLRYHTALHEDLAVNAVLGGGAPILHAWVDRLGTTVDVGLGEEDLRDVSTHLDPDAVDAYATEVADRTRAALAELDLATLTTIVDGEGALLRAGVDVGRVPWLVAMWTDRPLEWFVRWEAIGHLAGHVGEMVSIRNRLGLSPF
jgi:hypothetical protein